MFSYIIYIPFDVKLSIIIVKFNLMFLFLFYTWVFYFSVTYLLGLSKYKSPFPLHDQTSQVLQTALFLSEYI